MELFKIPSHEQTENENEKPCHCEPVLKKVGYKSSVIKLQ